MQDIKNRIEAVLFTVGRAITCEELASLCNLGSVGALKEALNELAKEYSERETALKLTVDDNVASLNIKKDYLYLTTKLLNDSELDRPTQETLALIAYKKPALQSDIIKMRGNGDYDQIKKLKELEFLTSEKRGRTRLLKLTAKFYDYFDIVEDKLRQNFSEIKEIEGTEPTEK